MNFVIGVCDGGSYMLSVFKKVLATLVLTDKNIQYIENPPGNPDLLIYSLFGDHHKKYTCPKILICGEPNDTKNHHPQLLIDCKNVPSRRAPGIKFMYLPFYVTSFGERFQNTVFNLLKDPNQNIDQIIQSKTKFCAFLYSQPVPFRNQLFDTINSYKAVDALGSQKSQLGKHTDRQHYKVGQSTYNDLAVQKYQPYKFVIACENAQLDGYITEKMTSPMLANAIPIYLGRSLMLNLILIPKVLLI